MTLPSIDQEICQSWTQTDVDQYNSLPYYLVKETSDFRKDWSVFGNLLDNIKWQQNMGDTLRAVMTERTPVLRQTAAPSLLSARPLVDVPFVRERIAETKPRWQDFQSVHFPFYPDFTDFLSHVQDSVRDMNRMVSIFEESYYKTYMFNQSPYVYLAGVGLAEAPVSDVDNASTGKSAAWLSAQAVALAGAAGGGLLSYPEIMNALNKFTQICGGTPFEGSGLPGKDSTALQGSYCLITSDENFNWWTADPYVLNNRPIQMNVVNEKFYGDPFGRFKVRLEAYPRRYRATGADFTMSTEAPETTEMNNLRPDYQRTKPNPLYADPANSQYAVSWLIGGKAYKKINVGPPPGDWTKVNPAMNWNGKAYLTKDFLIPCVDANDNTVYETNNRGRWLRAQASVTCGMLGLNTFNVLPIIHKRPQFIIPSQVLPNAA